MPDLKKAKKLISDAADLCVAAGRITRYQTQYVALEAEVKAARTALNPEPKRLTKKKEFQAIDTTIAAAAKKAVARDFPGASQLLDTARGQTAAKKELKQADDQYGAAVLPLQTDLKAFLKNPGKKNADMGSYVTAIEKALADAEKKAANLQYPDAMGLIKGASLKRDSLNLKKTLGAHPRASAALKGEFQKLAATPGGEKELDDIVSKLTDTDDTDVVLDAMKARFHLDSAESLGGSQSVAELKQYYVVMTKVPDSHTRDNPSFKKIVRKQQVGTVADANTQAQGSDYSSSNRAITMAEGHPDSSSPYVTGDATELPVVDPDCQPNATPRQPKYFDWNTLHEVGHALDDKLQFMVTKGKMDQYGGWEDLSGDILTVATAAAGVLGIDAKVIAVYLESKTEPTPAPANWAKAKAWADAIRQGKNPWKNGSACAKTLASGGFIINDRIYHEQGDKRWVSYKASARQQGITGYQFRAPGEWFAELYAAYKSDKLKPAHPARKWLQKFFAEKNK